MDKREAKRRVCEQVASTLIVELEQGSAGSQLDEADRERWQEAMGDLAEELLRRAGVVHRPHWVDPRQLSLGLEDERGTAGVGA